MESCVVGQFSDEVEFISQKDLSSTSIVLWCKNSECKENVINGLEDLDESTLVSFYPQVKKNRYLELEAEKGSVLVLTTSARTVSSSTLKAYDEIEYINFNGSFYRKDICKPLKIPV